MSKSLSTAAAVCGLLSCGIARAAIVNLAASKDNTLIQDAAGSLSNGKGSYFYSGRTALGSLRRGLLAFDLSAIPAGSTINSARLTVRVSRATSGTETYGLHVMNSNWGEGTSNSDGNVGGGGGSPATTGDATWTHAFTGGAAWATVGGDFAATASATQNIVGVASYSFTSAAMAQNVQAWLNAPSTNFGWAFLGNEVDDSSAKRFDSRDNANASFRPTLIVDYTPVPTVGSGLLGLAGAMAMSGRRRRAGSTR